MNNELYIDKILDDALKGTLAREEAGRLLQQENVADSENEIEMHFAAAVALQRHAVLMQVKNVHTQFVAAGDNIQKSTAKKTKGKVKHLKLVKWSLRIAAMLVLFAGGWIAWQYNNTSSAKLYAEMYQPYNVNTDRTGIGEIVPHKMIQQYKGKDYAAVIGTFQLLTVTNNREKFLAASAYHETGNYQQAIDILGQILQTNKQQGSRLYNDEAEFYTGLNYLKMKNGKAALPWFQKIYEDPNHTFHDRVNKWTLVRLKWLS